MKKFISLLLVLAMVCSLGVTCAFADEQATLKVTASKQTVQPGEEVTFTVSVAGTSTKTVSSVGFNVDVPDSLEYVSHKLAAGLPENTTYTAATGTFGFYNGKKSGTFDLVSITFKVSAAAKPGSIGVGIKQDGDLTMSDTEDETFDVTITPATITIPKPAITSVDVNVDAPSKGVAFATTATVPSGAEYSVTSVSWFEGNNAVHGDAAPSTVYTVKVVVTATSGSTFAKNVTAANGFTVKRDSDTQLTLTKTFPATAAHDCAWATEWSHDANSHWHACTVSGCNLRKDEAKHFGGTATCTDKAVCKICHVEYGNPQGHNLQKVAEDPATCTTDGVKAHYKCTVCNKLFSDAAGTQATDEEALKIPAAHKLAKVAEVPATCTTDGVKAHYKCTVCKKLFSDDAGTTETNEETLKLTKLGHAESTAYTYDATGHWKFCTRCGEVIGKAGHTWNKDTPAEGEAQFCMTCGYVKQAAKTPCEKQHADGIFTCDANGHYRICKACGAEYDREKHTFGPETTVNGKKFHSCTECGYTEEIKTVTPTTPSGNNSNAKNPYTKNDGKKVQSGKTFDAGIALYVGLSVLSVTGGALVIGKKKEF